MEIKVHIDLLFKQIETGFVDMLSQSTTFVSQYTAQILKSIAKFWNAFQYFFGRFQVFAAPLNF